MKKIKILVLGASGFVGSNLINNLSKDSKYILTGTYYRNKPIKKIKKVKFLKLDLLNYIKTDELIKKQDIVIMSAAISSGAKIIQNNPLIHLNDNLRMNINVFESCYKNKISKLIFLSSNTVYPNTEYPVKENDLNYNFFDKYFIVGWMKSFSEILCEIYSSKVQNPINVLIIRPGNLYGPYDKFDPEKSKVIPSLIRKVNLLKNHNDILEVWGDGKDIKDFLFIDDLVSFIKLSLKKKFKFEVVNVAYGHSVSIKKVIKAISKSYKKNFQIKFDKDMPSMIPVRKINISKAKNFFRWRPKFDLEAGIKKTVRWYLKENDYK